MQRTDEKQAHPAAGLSFAEMFHQGFLVRCDEKPSGGVYFTLDLLGADGYNRDMLDFISKMAAAGDEIILWSAAGRQHAAHHAEQAGIGGLVTACLSKPWHYVTLTDK
jgi:hypothetical protein